MTIRIIFMIGCTKMCEMWIDPEQATEAVKLMLELYGPLIPGQDYCVTLHSDPEREA